MTASQSPDPARIARRARALMRVAEEDSNHLDAVAAVDQATNEIYPTYAANRRRAEQANRTAAAAKSKAFGAAARREADKRLAASQQEEYRDA